MSNAKQRSKAAPSSAPLTDPSDLFALFGRFFLTVMFGMFAVTFLISQHNGVAVFFALLSIVMQIVTLRTWRRLRDERLAKKKAQERQDPTGDTPTEAAP